MAAPIDAFSSGFTAGRQHGGRFSAIGQGLQQLLQMGFQAKQQENELGAKAAMSAASDKAATDRAFGVQRMEGEQKSDEDRRKLEAANARAKLISNALKAPELSTEVKQGVLKLVHDDLNGDGVPDYQQTMPGFSRPANEALGGQMGPGVSIMTPPDAGQNAPGITFEDAMRKLSEAGVTPTGDERAQIEAVTGGPKGKKTLGELLASGDPQDRHLFDKTITAKVMEQDALDDAKFKGGANKDAKAKDLRENADKAAERWLGIKNGKEDFLLAAFRDLGVKGADGKPITNADKASPSDRAAALQFAEAMYKSKAKVYNAFVTKHGLEGFEVAPEDALGGGGVAFKPTARMPDGRGIAKNAAGKWAYEDGTLVQ